MCTDIEITEANLQNVQHQRDILYLTSVYAEDRMGINEPLSEDVKRRLIPELQKIPTAIIFIAYYKNDPIGIATCFIGFSTFSAKPLINIHDIGVIKEYRNKGIGRRLIDEVEKKARAIGCCKITLEVIDSNENARHLYEKQGFNIVVGGLDRKPMLLMSKLLS
jgi:ribosomal protein S18 acetylase RimI-like enzyme